MHVLDTAPVRDAYDGKDRQHKEHREGDNSRLERVRRDDLDEVHHRCRNFSAFASFNSTDEPQLGTPRPSGRGHRTWPSLLIRECVGVTVRLKAGRTHHYRETPAPSHSVARHNARHLFANVGNAKIAAENLDLRAACAVVAKDQRHDLGLDCDSAGTGSRYSLWLAIVRWAI
jgi:hypothetical protein